MDAQLLEAREGYRSFKESFKSRIGQMLILLINARPHLDDPEMFEMFGHILDDYCMLFRMTQGVFFTREEMHKAVEEVLIRSSISPEETEYFLLNVQRFFELGDES